MDGAAVEYNCCFWSFSFKYTHTEMIVNICHALGPEVLYYSTPLKTIHHATSLTLTLDFFLKKNPFFFFSPSSSTTNFSFSLFLLDFFFFSFLVLGWDVMMRIISLWSFRLATSMALSFCWKHILCIVVFIQLFTPRPTKDFELEYTMHCSSYVLTMLLSLIDELNATLTSSILKFRCKNIYFISDVNIHSCFYQ